MFGFLKNLFHKADDVHSAPAVHTPTAPARPTANTTGPAHPRASTPALSGPALELPLDLVLVSLPVELKARAKQHHGASAKLSISLDKILGQLSRGAIKLSFGELRRSAPQYFSPGADCDAIPVTLPLAEVLSRINPNLLTRRRPQKTIQIPAEISSPFDSHGRGLSISVSPAKAEQPAAEPLSPAKSNDVLTPPERQNLTAAPALEVPTVNLGESPFGGQRPLTSSKPSEAKPPQAPPLVIPLSILSEGWPEPVRHELLRANLQEAKVALPSAPIEKALSQGKIAFPWKTVRSWLTPVSTLNASPHDEIVVELPLKIIAPLFLSARRELPRRQKVAVDESIPNLFSGARQPEGAPNGSVSRQPTAETRPVDTNFYSLENSESRVKSESKPAASPGTSFVARYATPNEVVSRAAALDGVAGALIALPDGLMVASQLSPDLNADTLAAFLPQIFSKVSQCTKELRMGDLNNLNFTVGQVPWKIFRVNAIFFAAFGRAGETLPTAQLVALAAELDRKPK